eukprot:10439702-Ditylum_brightwellii.AAC.1
MATIAKPLKRLCIEYEPRFEHSYLEHVKLTQTYDNRMTKTKKCPLFTGAEGIEGLLYVEEHSAEEKWDTIVSNIDTATRTPEHFDQAIKELYLKYCDAQAKDTMFQYLHLLCRPTKVQPRDQSDCIETLVRYSNKLPGLSWDMNDDQVKQMVFDQHPETWRKFYIRSGMSLETDTLADTVQFMSNEKGFADRDDKKKRKQQQEEGGGRGNNKKQKTNGKKKIRIRENGIPIVVFPTLLHAQNMDHIIQ